MFQNVISRKLIGRFRCFLTFFFLFKEGKGMPAVLWMYAAEHDYMLLLVVRY